MKKKYFMIQIDGNVVEEALNIAVTELARFRDVDNTTLIRMYARDKKCGGIIETLYGKLGEIKQQEYCE